MLAVLFIISLLFNAIYDVFAAIALRLILFSSL